MHNSITATAALAGAALLTVASASAGANDFPTQARVEYVLQCVKDNGGETYKNLYGCVCMIDKIAEQMSFADYDEGTTFGNMRTVPGERSGVFRDNARGRRLGKTLEQVREDAANACLMSKARGES
ncbi:MAG: hypothetical protein AAGA68_09610 [Pseudomonadota bacterium]